ncbi:MAG: thiamine/thiamine pyrophosphate ABC transporter permease ThiP [Rhodobacteraceae bacterium]|nr:thiamine/thiamine pyrophosphate ABC transporter permease ThiP [Paracoccaceae bacterium]
MAGRAEPVSPRAGYGAAALVAALILVTLGAVVLRADAPGALGRADWAAIRFTLLQAALSAALSVLLAIPVARALARRDFVGRAALITLLGAPFILPVIVAVLGLLSVFGRAGWVSGLLGVLGLEPIHVYGLHGVVLAHVFFNLPLATRLILQGWQDIPGEQYRLAAQLGAGPGVTQRLLEWPMLRRVVPGALAIIFAICLTSFAVALTLGGGPRATTIELAIYQAFRFDFDLNKAALLACVQIVLTGAAALVALRVEPEGGLARAGLGRPAQRWDSGGLLLQDAAVITLAALFLILPLLAIVMDGLAGLWPLPPGLFGAAVTSVLVALLSTGVLLALALPISVAAAQPGCSWLEGAGLLGLAVSPLVIGTGLFILLNPVVNPAALAVPVTACVNAVMALPFALRILVPRARQLRAAHARLALSLNMQGWPMWRYVLLPRMRPQIGFSAGLTAALSMGDLGVITLFADPQMATLPLFVFRLMGAYQMQSAAGVALILLALSVALFWFFDQGGRRHAGA